MRCSPDIILGNSARGLCSASSNQEGQSCSTALWKLEWLWLSQEQEAAAASGEGVQDVPVAVAGVSIAKDSGNEISAQGKRNLALLPGKEPCSSAPGAKSTISLLQGVMKWWGDPGKR